jgi:hypothetical protein
MFDSLIGRGQRLYHTGGYLGEGEVVWRVTATPTSSLGAEKDRLKSAALKHVVAEMVYA